MKLLDIIILVPLLWGAYKGFTKGFVMEIVSLLAFVLAILIAFKTLHIGIELIRPHLDAESFLPVISFILIFISVVLLVNLMGKLIKKFLDITLLGKVDDIAGAILGALKWAFGLSTILWLMNQAQIVVPNDVVEGSVLFPYLVKYGPSLINTLSAIVPYGRGIVDSINELLVPLQ